MSADHRQSQSLWHGYNGNLLPLVKTPPNSPPRFPRADESFPLLPSPVIPEQDQRKPPYEVLSSEFMEQQYSPSSPRPPDATPTRSRKETTLWLLATALFLIGTGCSFLYYLNVQDDVALADALQSFPHDRCWSDTTFGKPVSIADHQVYEVTQEMCEASQTIWGGEGMNLGRVADHLFNCDGDRGLSVYIVGGSITCGAGKNRETRPDSPCAREDSGACYDEAWPRRLEEVLNTHYPCPQAGIHHTVINDCVGGVGSEYWVDKFARHRHQTDHPLTNADIVLVETAANDGWLETPSDASMNTELLARIIRRLDSKPLAMWVTASWHSGNYNWTDPNTYRRKLGYHRDAEEQHLNVLRYYNIPHLSMLQAFQPLAGNVARHEFFQKVYQTDGVHPSVLGHKIIASMVAHRIEKQAYVATRSPSWFDRWPLIPYVVPRVLIREAAYQATILDKANEVPLTLDFQADGAESTLTGKVVEMSWFGFAEDVPGKSGLIGTKVGATTTLALSDLKTGLILIGLLHSYQHMGVVKASLMVPLLNGSESTTTAPGVTSGRRGSGIQKLCRQVVHGGPPDEAVETLATLTVDTQWKQQVSLMDTSNMYISLRLLKQHLGHCGWLQLEIIGANPARAENKIKVLQVSVF